MDFEAWDAPDASATAQATAFLARREAEHNLLLGILAPWARPGTRSDPPYLAVVRRGGAVQAVAVRTPPRPVVLSLGWEEASCRRLAQDLAMRPGRLPGVLGPNDSGPRFAAAWTAVIGGQTETALRERIYALDAVEPVAQVPGHMEAATGADRPMLYGWIEQFLRETGADIDPRHVRAMVDARSPAGAAAGLFLWRVGAQAVAVAGYAGATPTGIRVAPVYTPAAFRRQGYATALVAELSRLLLGRGHRRLFLFTDLANPTSNAIYRTVGYRPVADVTEHRFVDPAGASRG